MVVCDADGGEGEAGRSDPGPGPAAADDAEHNEHTEGKGGILDPAAGVGARVLLGKAEDIG